MVDLRGKLPTRLGAAGYGYRDPGRIIGVTLHYTASSPYDTVESIASWQVTQMEVDPYPAIAYTLIVTRDGTIYLCNSLDRRTWHSAAPGRNEFRIGICYVGNLAPNVAQKISLAKAIYWCEIELGRRLTDIEGHGDGMSTDCPGPTWPGWKVDVVSFLNTMRW